MGERDLMWCFTLKFILSNQFSVSLAALFMFANFITHSSYIFLIVRLLIYLAHKFHMYNEYGCVCVCMCAVMWIKQDCRYSSMHRLSVSIDCRKTITKTKTEYKSTMKKPEMHVWREWETFMCVKVCKEEYILFASQRMYWFSQSIASSFTA